MTAPDRRRSTREPCTQACKLFHEPSLRFLGGRTINCSDDGLLVELLPPHHLRSGDLVQIALSDDCLAPAKSMQTARVTRSASSARGLLVGLHLEMNALPAAAA